MPDSGQTNTTGTASVGADIDQYGDKSILIGLPSAVKTVINGMAILELNDDSEPQFTVEVPGQDGSIAAFGKAKKKKFSGSGNGILLKQDDFEKVDSFEFSGRTYIITKHGAAYNYKEAVKASFSYVGYEGVAK